MTTTTTAVITATLGQHQGSWDSWGWHCTCGQREDLVPAGTVMDTPATVERHSRAGEARDALLRHQADAVATALAA